MDHTSFPHYLHYISAALSQRGKFGTTFCFLYSIVVHYSGHLACIMLRVLLLLYHISKYHEHNTDWWGSMKYRENLVNSWCFGSCLSGIFMFGLLLVLYLDSFIPWAFYRVLTPVWFVDMTLVAFSLFVSQVHLVRLTFKLTCAPQQVYRVSKEEINSCLLGNLFLLLPSFLFEVWLYKRLDEQLSLQLTPFLCIVCLLITILLPVAQKLNLFSVH